MGPKKIDINVYYNGEKKLFNCEQYEVAKVISSYFKISLKEVTMYYLSKGVRHQISPNDIIDMMVIHIIPNGQKTIQSCLEREISKKMVDSMITKLRNNTSLNDLERQLLIEALETHSTGFFKRKLEEMDIDKPVVYHKKLQVNIPADNKESFSQTDNHNIFPVVENTESSEVNAKQLLKRLWNHDAPKEEIERLMHETYDGRRNFITIQCPPIAVIREHYPALFCFEQVRNELDRIFYPGKCDEFLDNMNIYMKHILHYNYKKIDDILEMTKTARSHARTPKQKAYAEVVGSIFVLARLLDDNFGFIHLSNHPHSSKDVFPHIDASLYSLKKIFFDDICYHIVVEGRHLCEAPNFPEAILCLMASFFIFNINYPESCRRTLTVIEKVYLKANDTMEMDDETQQWIKLLNMREMKSRSTGTENKINQAKLDTFLKSY